MYLFVYMLAKAGQTAKPNGLNFFVRTLGLPRGNISLKNENFYYLKKFQLFFSKIIFFLILDF